jgi:phospholipase/carboxylesterase
MSTDSFPPPTVVEAGVHADTGDAPLVVLFHGRGSDAHEIAGLVPHLPARFAYVAVRAPIAEGGGFAWFANRGIGRPIAESLAAAMGWFRAWLDGAVATGRPVYLVGFSGGAAFAGGLLLADPTRWAGTAILNGTLPFEAGVPTTPGHLAGRAVFLSHGATDTVIPVELQQRTWAYLTEESGAAVLARHDQSGHQITAPALHALSQWLEGLAEEEHA